MEEKKQRTSERLIAIVVVIVGIGLVLASMLLMRNAKTDETTLSASGGAGQEVGGLIAVDGQAVLDFLADKGTGFLYVGRTTCPYCQAFMPILTEVIRERRLQVRYYDADVADSELELRNEVLAAVNVTGVPTFMYVREGRVIAVLGDTSSRESLVTFLDGYR